METQINLLTAYITSFASTAQVCVSGIKGFVVGWPLVIFVAVVAIICSVYLSLVQLRYFWHAWKVTLYPQMAVSVHGDVSPMGAFINTLSANLGNGSIAGVATAIFAGGPGAVFWLIFFGTMLMAVRFAEVYLSVDYGARQPITSTLGGPMLYLRKLTGGRIIAYLYALLCTIFGFLGGCAIQANSISDGMARTFGVAPFITAITLSIFILFALLGGAPRIVALSDALVPLKVVVFFATALVVLGYNYTAIPAALILIITSAFNPYAIAGGAIGYAVKDAVRYGLTRSVFATESGLGTAAVFFGFTHSPNPVRSALMGMISTFVSMIVCIVVALCLIVTGAWMSGANGCSMMITAYDSVFGTIGGWIVTLLTITFGIGVMVAYAYLTRAAWMAATNGIGERIFQVLYVAAALLGALVNLTAVWDATDVITVIMLVINLIGIAFLLPEVKSGLARYHDA